jgi:hypothetical protein
MVHRISTCSGADTCIHNTKDTGNDIRYPVRVLPIDKDAAPGGFEVTGETGSRERTLDIAAEHADKMVLYGLAFEE